MIRRVLARKVWARGEPLYMTDPAGAVFQLPETDEHGMVSGEDLKAFLADAGISVEEWLQMSMKHREQRINRVLAVSAAAAGLMGVVLVLFGGWSSLVGALVAAVAVVVSGWAVALKYGAAREGR